jgi:hypothetical protein
MNNRSLCVWAVLLAAVPAYAGTPVTIDTSNGAAPRSRRPGLEYFGGRPHRIGFDEMGTRRQVYSIATPEFDRFGFDPASGVLSSHRGAGAVTPLPETPALAPAGGASGALAWDYPKRGGPA